MILAQLPIVARVCGFLFLVLSGAMAFCAAVDAALGGSVVTDFLVSSLIVAMAGAALFYGPPKTGEVNTRGVILSVCVAWLLVSVVSAAPIALAIGVSPVDALFEAASGLTTTGATILSRLDTLSPGVLLWRSLLQWMGGVGILAMGLVLLPILGVGGMQASRMESSDVSDLSRGRYRQYTRAVLLIYIGLTLTCAAAYTAFGMPPFDAINHAMTTLATGGYSTHDASFGYYGHEKSLLLVAAFFMTLASLPFSLYAALALSLPIDWVTRAQTRLFLVVVAALSIGCALMAGWNAPSEADVVFNVISVLSTSGYASADYSTWGDGVMVVILIATFIGGCAGSTSGGAKVLRLIVLFEFVSTYLAKLTSPHIITRSEIRLTRDTQATQAAVSFLTLFLASLLLITLTLLATGLDALTSFSGALTALSNVGPGFGAIIGPAGNFEALPDAAKLALIAGMIIGRLEFVAVMAIAHPVFWR